MRGRRRLNLNNMVNANNRNDKIAKPYSTIKVNIADEGLTLETTCSYTLNPTGEKHTISTFVDQTRI